MGKTSFGLGIIGLIGVLCTFGCRGNSGASLSAASSSPFSASVISSPNQGYQDSLFINALGDRIYFLDSVLSVNDFLGGTDIYPHGPFLPGHTVGAGLDWNTDLYYVQWTGTEWSAPINLGSNINTLGNECCVWLNSDETEIIFYRDTMGIGALGPTGNFRATRADRNASWGAAVALPNSYGVTDQSSTRYRHDIQKSTSGDLYLWEHDSTYPNGSRLLYGRKNGATWDAPAAIAGTDNLVGVDETQPWVSSDELTLMFNRRDVTGNTTLWRSTRATVVAAWGAPALVSTVGFADGATRTIWGEPTLSQSEAYILFIRFDTSQMPWKAQMMYAPGTPATGYTTPIPLN